MVAHGVQAAVAVGDADAERVPFLPRLLVRVVAAVRPVERGGARGLDGQQPSVEQVDTIIDLATRRCVHVVYLRPEG